MRRPLRGSFQPGKWLKDLLHPCSLLGPQSLDGSGHFSVHDQDQNTCMDWCISQAAITKKGGAQNPRILRFWKPQEQAGTMMPSLLLRDGWWVTWSLT